jgi:hypothetical protein
MICEPFLGEQDAKIVGRWIKKVEKQYPRNYEWIMLLSYFLIVHKHGGRQYKWWKLKRC